MRVTLKIPSKILHEARTDLERRHVFAHERVGFFRAAAAGVPGGIILCITDYHPVADEDYERSADCGAQIGSEAMRKAVQAAYKPARALLHVHSHGGHGKPVFSHTDTRSADEFVPGFFSPVPRMPHGLLVLSDDSATGLLWTDPKQRPLRIESFVKAGQRYSRDWKS